PLRRRARALVTPGPTASARRPAAIGTSWEPRCPLPAWSTTPRSGALMPDGTPPRCLFLVPLASAFGSNGTAVALARHGGTLVLLDHFTPEAALAAVRDHRPTHVLGVPTMIRMMLEALERTDEPLPAPTALVLGGAPLDEATAKAAADAFGCPVVNLYGSADGVNCHTGLQHTVPPTDRSGVVAGRPDPRVAEIRITDPDTHEPLPEGRIGEIVSRGPMTPLCYVGSPELDARYRTPEGWVRTGDLGFLDADGVLHVAGRLKDVVIRGGANISPAEVERELVSHPGVRDAVCVGVPDPLMGERLAVCLVAKDPAAPSLAELGAYLTERGLDRHKHPEHLLVLPELPLTAAGKPDRAALRTRIAEDRKSVLVQA
ncbi:class I adenylate-forming enzyme family protein, partial [Streptomyces massasporeus]